MNRSILSLFSAASLAFAGSGAALAQEQSQDHGPGQPAAHEAGGHGGGDYPLSYIERPLELPKGMLEVQAGLGASLSKDAIFKPVLLGFGANYGVDGHLQLGISTSGFCLTGSDSGCAHFFNDFAIEAAYGVLHQKGFELSLQGGLEFSNLSGTTNGNDTPLEVAGGFGIDLKAVFSSQFAIRAGPKLVFGLKEREGLNREYLRVPIDFQYQVDPHLTLDLGISMEVLLDPPNPFGFGDFLSIPMSVGARYAVDKHLDVGAAFTFNNLLGKGGSIDYRTFQIYGAYRFF